MIFCRRLLRHKITSRQKRQQRLGRCGKPPDASRLRRKRRAANRPSYIPHRDAVGSQIRLGFGDAVFAKVKDPRGQDAIGFADEDAVDQVLQIADAA